MNDRRKNFKRKNKRMNERNGKQKQYETVDFFLTKLRDDNQWEFSLLCFIKSNYHNRNLPTQMARWHMQPELHSNDTTRNKSSDTILSRILSLHQVICQRSLTGWKKSSKHWSRQLGQNYKTLWLQLCLIWLLECHTLGSTCRTVPLRVLCVCLCN